MAYYNNNSCGCMKEENCGGEKKDCSCQEFMRVYDWYNCICDKAYREFEDAQNHLYDTIDYMNKGFEYNCKAKEISEYIEDFVDAYRDKENDCGSRKEKKYGCEKSCNYALGSSYGCGTCGIICGDSCDKNPNGKPCMNYNSCNSCNMCNTCDLEDINVCHCDNDDYNMMSGCKTECTCKKECNQCNPCMKMRKELEEMKEELYALQKESLMHTKEAIESLDKAKKMVKCLNEMKCKVANSCYPKC